MNSGQSQHSNSYVLNASLSCQYFLAGNVPIIHLLFFSRGIATVISSILTIIYCQGNHIANSQPGESRAATLANPSRCLTSNDSANANYTPLLECNTFILEKVFGAFKSSNLSDPFAVQKKVYNQEGVEENDMFHLTLYFPKEILYYRKVHNKLLSIIEKWRKEGRMIII